MKKHIQEDNIKIFKYKFYIPGKHYYGCSLIVINVEKFQIIKYSSVISLNPAVYEIDLTQSLDKIEKLIYKYKLEKGALFEFTKNLYLKIYEYEKKIVSFIDEEKIGNLIDIIFNILNISNYGEEKIKFIYKINKNLKDIEEEIKTVSANSLNKVINYIDEKIFFIKTKPVFDKDKGIFVYKLKQKMNLQCIIIDNRELVKQIIKILYGKEEKYINGKISTITRKNKGYFEIVVNITPVILTKFIVHKLQKIKLV